jgi:molybdate transport system substrate-binding protein
VSALSVSALPVIPARASLGRGDKYWIFRMRKLATAVATGALIALGGSAHAVEIKALITTALKTSIEELAPQFERATGHKLRAAYGPSSVLIKRLADGEDADFVIVGGDGIEVLIKRGKVMDGSGVKFARSMIGAAVAKGAPKPDISSAEAFKRALLAAKSVAYSDAASGGASGVYLAKVFETMGIAAALKAKAKLAAGGPDGFAAAFVINGEAEIALQPIPELMAVPGIDIVGPLPGDFQNVTTYAAGVPVFAAEPEAAAALIKFLSTPAAAAVFKAKGLDPHNTSQ